MLEWLQARCQTKKWLIHPRGDSQLENPGGIPSWEIATTWDMFYSSQGGNASCQGLNGTRVETFMVPLTISSGNQVTPAIISLPGIYGALCRGDFILLRYSWNNKNTINQDGDSPVERNLQSDGQETNEANMPRVASTINMLHLEQNKLSEAARRRLLREKKRAAGQANTDTGSNKQTEQTTSTSERATGAGSGTSKRTRKSCGTPTSTIIKVVQINLHHSKAVSTLMCRKLLVDNIVVALIQEPWLFRAEIRGLRCKEGSIFSPNCDNPKTCIYVKN